MTQEIKKNPNDWYVLYTSPRAEKQVKIRLEQLDSVDEVFLPIHLCPKVWSDRVKIVETPLFNSYIFVRCNKTVIHNLLSVYGVSRIVYYDRNPAIVRSREILNIKKFLELAAKRELIIGDNVNIVGGAFKEKSGKILSITKKEIVLSLNQINATISVKLDIVTKAT
jgi:transcription antitermination factor NusG